jgi:hypothetical protein
METWKDIEDHERDRYSPSEVLFYPQDMNHDLDPLESVSTEKRLITSQNPDYDWVKEEYTKQKLIDLERRTESILSDTSSGHISIQINSTRLVEQRLQHIRRLQFDEKKALFDILHDKNDQIDIINEASKVSYSNLSHHIDNDYDLFLK